MPSIVIPSVVILGLAWVTGLYSNRTRNARFIVVGLVISAVWLAASAAGPPFVSFRVVIASVLGLIVLFPQAVGLTSVTSAERLADIEIAGLDRGSIRDTPRRLEVLERVRTLVPNDAGRLVAARLALWGAAQRNDPGIIKSTVRADYFADAGSRFLRDAQWRRILGAPKCVTPWDEDIALRCFHYESKNLIPLDVFAHEPPVAIGPWATSVETLLTDLANAPLQDHIAQQTRVVLAEAIRAYLRLATGDRTSEATEHQVETANALEQAWDAMADHLEPLYGGRPNRV
jgi:hypothetical protein